MIQIVLVGMLICASAANALPKKPPPDGDPPVVECSLSDYYDAAGTLSASPSSIDILRDAPMVSTLTWSAVPSSSGCPSDGFEISGQFVARSGSVNVTLPTRGSYTFALSLRTPAGLKFLASASVLIEPVSITVSSGTQVTQNDIQVFDKAWMNPALVHQALLQFDGDMRQSNLVIGWDIGERAEAMVDMYELTREPRYVEHMRDIIEIILRNRDDRRTDIIHFDEFRPDWPRPMAGWGQSTAATAFYWTTIPSMDVGGFLSYVMAAFARIVAEDPGLQARYGQSALTYTNAVRESFETYYSMWQTRTSGNHSEMYLQGATSPLLTQSNCDQAYALSGNPEFHKECLDMRYPSKQPYNATHLQVMTAIELYRALDSSFYQQSPAYVWTAAADRNLIPSLVTQSHRFFVNDLRTTHMVGAADIVIRGVPPSGVPRFLWEYIGDSDSHFEDPSHGGVSMRYLGVLRENQARLNANLPAWDEPIALSSEDLTKFANTFVYNVVQGQHLAHDVTGRAENPIDLRDAACTGWLSLSQADPRVYEACAAITLRHVDVPQPYVGIANHAALLKNKRYRTP